MNPELEYLLQKYRTERKHQVPENELRELQELEDNADALNFVEGRRIPRRLNRPSVLGELVNAQPGANQPPVDLSAIQRPQELQPTMMGLPIPEVPKTSQMPAEEVLGRSDPKELADVISAVMEDSKFTDMAKDLRGSESNESFAETLKKFVKIYTSE